MGANPPNHTVVLKRLHDGADAAQVKQFVLSATPGAFNIRIAKDNSNPRALAGYTVTAYANYSCESLARSAKVRLDSAIAQLLSGKGRQTTLDLTKCVTFMKDEGYKPPVNYPVWIGNIVDESIEDLDIIFSRFGALNKGRVFPAIRVFDRCAIINYSSFASAQSAVEACNSKMVKFGNNEAGNTYAIADARDTTRFLMDLRAILCVSRSIEYASVAQLAGQNKISHALWQIILSQNSDIFKLNPTRSTISLTSAASASKTISAQTAPTTRMLQPQSAQAPHIPPKQSSSTAWQRSDADPHLPATKSAWHPPQSTLDLRIPSPGPDAAWEEDLPPDHRAQGALGRRPSVANNPPETGRAVTRGYDVIIRERVTWDDDDTAVTRTWEEGEVTAFNGGGDEEDVTCDPITMEVMRDPVLAADGRTYERAGIEAWMRGHGPVSMVTRAPLPHAFLTPNKAVRDLIERRHPHVVLAPFVL